VTDGTLVIFIVLLCVGPVIFLAMREIMCWYFKVNTMVSRMDSMIQHLETISKSAQPPQSIAPTLPSTAPRNLLHGMGPTQATRPVQ
jgi:hypothetical protein